MKLSNKKNIFKSYYLASILVLFVVGYIVNAYYDLVIYKNILILALVVLMLTLVFKKHIGKFYIILKGVCEVIIVIPFSKEFFSPLIEIDSAYDIFRIASSLLIIYPILILGVILSWIHLFYEK